MIPKVIKTEEDYRRTLARIEALMDAKAGTPKGDELELLSALVELYEEKQYPINLPDPVDAIKFRMDQLGLRQKDMVIYFGSKSKASEILNGKTPLTISMMRALHVKLGIPAEVLLHSRKAQFPQACPEMHWVNFPLREMAKRRWIKKVENIKKCAEEIMMSFFEEAGGKTALSLVHCRRGISSRYNERTDDYAMMAWRLRVLSCARKEKLPKKFKDNLLTNDKLHELIRLSVYSKGPLLAKEFLNKLGICLIIEPHLPKTYLDGAAMLLPDGSPVIALTLRHDRIDNFWFSLLHELAHVSLHLRGTEDCFLDDLDMKITDTGEDSPEREADKVATEAEIPTDFWEGKIIGKKATTAQIQEWADELKIHPAIIAGRIRYHTGDYRQFARLVGTGSVRRQFEVKK
jgi:HTH-type transcriptional regulator/antitoxin HigA